MSEALSAGMLRTLVIYFLGYVKLGEYAIKEGKKNNNKKNTKGSLINKGRLETEGFLTSNFLIFCSVRHAQGFLVVNHMGLGFAPSA